MAFIGGNFVDGSGPQMPSIGNEGNLVVGGEAISIGDNYAIGGGVQVAGFPPGHEGISIGGNYVDGVGVASFPPGHEGISIGGNYVDGVGVAGNEPISIGDNFVHGGEAISIGDNSFGGPQQAAMFSGEVAEEGEPAEEAE